MHFMLHKANLVNENMYEYRNKLSKQHGKVTIKKTIYISTYFSE